MSDIMGVRKEIQIAWGIWRVFKVDFFVRNKDGSVMLGV